VRRRHVHPLLRLALLGAALVAALSPTVHAAPSPVSWCGGSASASDRPDVVGGDQIHVVYAVPSDGSDRFASLATPIAADVGAIGDWWRKQDPTRQPRFDLAAFSCSGPGSLDISDVRLPHPTAYYNGSAPRIQLLRDDLVAAGFDDPAKKYLVYYDQSQSAAGTDCGSAYVNAQAGGEHGFAAVYLAPNLGGCGAIGTAGYLAVVAAHELVNALGALDSATPGPPHRCANDPLHVCDNTLDVLAPRPAATTLATAILDYGHDDYYAHTGSWWDVQDSPWLRHLDAHEYRVVVTVGKGGQSVVDTTQRSISCSSARCGWTWQAGSELTLSATAGAGYRFVGWTGCPSAQTGDCTLTVEAPVRIGALFAPPLRLTGFHLALSRDRRTLTATLHLSAAGPGRSVDCAFAQQPVVASSVRGTVATCAWRVPSRFRGHRLTGSVTLTAQAATLVRKPFHVRVPKP
jgi:Divergent InlB B-repeat domain